jgi:hypothetical protein
MHNALPTRPRRNGLPTLVTGAPLQRLERLGRHDIARLITAFRAL